MDRNRFLGFAVVSASLLLAGACNKQKQAAPDLQTASGGATAPRAITVTGCLKAGTLADSTWVLMATDTNGGTEKPATYQLVGGDPDNLRNSAGQQVEVSGTVQADEQIASSSGPVPERAAKGTSGTPSVETKTDVDLKRLQVSAVKPTGNHCS